MGRTTVFLAWLAVVVLLPPGAPADPPDPDSRPAASENSEQAAPADAAATEPEVAFVPPQIILGTQKQPTYPPAAWDARFTGSVLLEMTVLADGTVGNVQIVECDRPKVGFEDAAVDAVSQWRFEPGLEHGEPVDVTTRLRLNFTRVGVGLRARPQVSAGSFSVASHDSGRQAGSGSGWMGSSGGGGGGGGGDRK